MSMEEKIHVLLVGGPPETEDSFAEHIMLDGGIEIIDTAETGQEAIETVRRVAPNIILINFDLPDMDGPRATKLIMAEVSDVPMIMLSVPNDTTVIRQAVLAGVSSFLVKPYTNSALLDSIRKCYQMEINRRRTRKLREYLGYE
jgi:DNA-binding NarL/FixJ family response regulator